MAPTTVPTKNANKTLSQETATYARGYNYTVTHTMAEKSPETLPR